MNENEDYRTSCTCDHIRWLAVGMGMGLLVGGALGLLFAPKSGAETRQGIADKTTEVTTKAKNIATDVHTKVTDKAQQVGQQARTVAQDVSRKATEVKVKVTDKAQQVGQQARAVAQDVSKKATDMGQSVKQGVEVVRATTSQALEAGQKGFRQKVDELQSKESAELGDQIQP